MGRYKATAVSSGWKVVALGWTWEFGGLWEVASEFIFQVKLKLLWKNINCMECLRPYRNYHYNYISKWMFFSENRGSKTKDPVLGMGCLPSRFLARDDPEKCKTIRVIIIFLSWPSECHDSLEPGFVSWLTCSSLFCTVWTCCQELFDKDTLYTS